MREFTREQLVTIAATMMAVTQFKESIVELKDHVTPTEKGLVGLTPAGEVMVALIDYTARVEQILLHYSMNRDATFQDVMKRISTNSSK